MVICGITGSCTAQLVVESDGSTYPCDFFVLDEYRSGDLTKQTLKDVYASSANRRFAAFNPALPNMCSQCPYLRICGGGCKRMRQNVCFTEDNKTCGYKLLLDATIDRFIKIAQQQRMLSSDGGHK